MARRSLLLLLWVLVPITIATGAVGPPMADSARRQVRFRVFSPDPIGNLAFETTRADGTSSGLRSLWFFPTAFSARYECEGDGILRFVDLASEDPVAEIDVRDVAEEFVVLFARRQEASGAPRYELTVFDGILPGRPRGGLRIVNSSGLILEAEVDGRRFLLGEGVNDSALDRTGMVPVTLYARFRGRDYQAFRDTIALGGNAGAWLFLFAPIRAGSVEIQSRVLAD